MGHYNEAVLFDWKTMAFTLWFKNYQFTKTNIFTLKFWFYTNFYVDIILIMIIVANSPVSEIDWLLDWKTKNSNTLDEEKNKNNEKQRVWINKTSESMFI